MKKLILAILLFSLTGFFQAYPQDTLTILHLNDTHSTLAPVGPRTDNLEGTQGGIARAATIIGMTKMTETNVLTLHAGDFSIGDLFYNKFFGVPELQILKSLGLDAMTVGNHEWDLSPAAFLGTLQNAFPSPSDGFPLLSANTDLSDPSLAELKNYISPYTIKQVGNIKVGIFGMTTPITNLTSQPAPAVISEDITTIAANMVSELSAQNCNVIIFLSHLGLNLDKIIGENIPGINIIVGGHDHYLLDPPVEVTNPLGQKVWIVQANSNYLDIGKVKLVVDNGNVTLLSSHVIPLDASVPEEPTVKATVDALIFDIESFYGIPFYTQQVGYATSFFKEVETDLTSYGSHDTPIGNLVTDAFRQKTGTDIAIQPGGSTAMPLYKGPFVPADLYRVNGYGFNTINTLGFQLVTYDITGANLYAGLEFGLSEIESDDEYLLQVSGLEYTYDSNLPVGSRVTSVKVNGKPLDPNKTYSVTSSEFLTSFLNYLNIPYTNFKLLEGVTEFQALMEYVTAIGSVIYPKVNGRIANVNSSEEKGMINGEGWFDSPKGALFNNPNVEGKMLFALNVHIKKNQKFNGNVLINFPKRLQFSSSGSLEWLTINNSTGQIKGSGKINGKGNYGFLITAISNNNKFITHQDKIHIRIWDKGNGNSLVYDNFSEQNIRGNINIIEKNKLSKEIEETANVLPTKFELSQNYPNPFNPTTTFQFQIPEKNHVTLKVYDILGNEVATIVNEQLTIGIYKYLWNASDLASGVYIYRLQAGNYVNTKKLILMK